MKDEENEIDVTDGCVGLLIFLVAIPFGAVTTKILWNGLIAGTFDLITLNFWQALGLDWFVSYLIAGTGKKSDNTSLVESGKRAIEMTFWCLMFGLVIMQFL